MQLSILSNVREIYYFIIKHKFFMVNEQMDINNVHMFFH